MQTAALSSSSDNTEEGFQKERRNKEDYTTALPETSRSFFRVLSRVMRGPANEGTTDNRDKPSEKIPGSSTLTLCGRVRKVTCSHSAKWKASQFTGG